MSGKADETALAQVRSNGTNAISVPPAQSASPQKEDKRYPVSNTGTLGKALSVLDVIASSRTPMRFTDVLHKLDQPRGTLHRQIQNLVEEGLIEIGLDQSYSLGPRLLKLAASAWSKNTFRVIAEPHIEQLHDATGETVHLGVLNRVEVIYLDKIESRQTVRMHSQVGNASPAYCTGIGKAMLAVLPAGEFAQRVREIEFQRHTENTIVDAASLLAEMEAIRVDGVSHDREENEPGIRCVAAPISDNSHRIIAGVSVTAPSYRLNTKDIERWTHLVRKTADNILADMEDLMGPRNRD